MAPPDPADDATSVDEAGAAGVAVAEPADANGFPAVGAREEPGCSAVTAITAPATTATPTAVAVMIAVRRRVAGLAAARVSAHP